MQRLWLLKAKSSSCVAVFQSFDIQGVMGAFISDEPTIFLHVLVLWWLASRRNFETLALVIASYS